MKKTERVWGSASRIFKSIDFVKLLVLAMVVLCAACNKDDDEDGVELQYLEGSPYFTTPMYAMVGEEIELKASGVTTDSVSYSWSFPGLDSVAVVGSDKSTIKLKIPDTLGTFTITVTASAGDYYYSAIHSKTLTTVGEKSLGGVERSLNYFTDPRDSQLYGYEKIGNLEWFTSNLNWKGAGYGYARSDAAAFVYGRLYTWNDATGGVSASGLGQGVQGVCPEGWSIPTKEDWEDLSAVLNGGEVLPFSSDWTGLAGKLMAPATFNGEKIWPYSPDVDITNDYGWNALAAGTCTLDYSQFSNVDKYGFWWSGTEKDSNNAHFRYIYSEYPNVSFNFSSKDGMAASVRCVRLAN